MVCAYKRIYVHTRTFFGRFGKDTKKSSKEKVLRRAVCTLGKKYVRSDAEKKSILCRQVGSVRHIDACCTLPCTFTHTDAMMKGEDGLADGGGGYSLAGPRGGCNVFGGREYGDSTRARYARWLQSFGGCEHFPRAGY